MITQESPQSICDFVVALWGKAVNSIDNARQRSIARADAIKDGDAALIQHISNTNTVPTELKRALLLQKAIVEFAKRLVPVRQFSSVLSATPLQGTDKVEIPYFGLETAASTDFDAEDGYTMGDSTTSSRELTIDRRKYQSLAWSSSELRRQPFLNLLQLAQLKSAKLGVDVWLDLLSLVTAANYPTVAYTGVASTFTAAVVAGLKLAAKNFPEVGRSLFVDSAYDANLLTDSAIVAAINSGTTEALREGRVGSRLNGFDYLENPNIPSNGENLVGWLSSPSAILFAQAPIQPSDEVRSQLTSYEIVTEPASGISFEYRLWGNADMDGSREVIECNYGFAKGNSNALQRIRSAA